MDKRRSYSFHLESMNEIIERQNNNEGIKGFIVEESPKRFQPRQYIKMESSKQIQLIDMEEIEFD